MSGIHQFLPMLAKGDGVGNNARAMAKRLAEVGIPSRFYSDVDNIGEASGGHLDYAKVAEEGDILLYHVATSSPMTTYLAHRSEPLGIVYHNITPPEYFAAYDARAAAVQKRAEGEVEALAERTLLAMTPSAYNAEDLYEARYLEVAEFPLIFDPADFLGPSSPRVEEVLSGLRTKGFANWLFVGRLVPNKAQERLIMALHAHREAYGDTAVLHLVGRPSYPGYVAALHGLADELGLADRVNFVMGVSEAELAAFYRSSDLFISASEHEGFCIPIVEALFHGLPVMAYDAGAVPETLGIGGIHLPDRDPATMAAWTELIATDAELRSRLRRLGREQLTRVAPTATIPAFDRAIARLIELAGS
ncbi:MAG: glycosyltransferase, partial [Actinomycetota bacterium]|nr:glycosyltransferase [Actinomycetota bacterium]